MAGGTRSPRRGINLLVYIVRLPVLFGQGQANRVVFYSPVFFPLFFRIERREQAAHRHHQQQPRPKRIPHPLVLRQPEHHRPIQRAHGPPRRAAVSPASVCQASVAPRRRFFDVFLRLVRANVQRHHARRRILPPRRVDVQGKDRRAVLCRVSGNRPAFSSSASTGSRVRTGGAVVRLPAAARFPPRCSSLPPALSPAPVSSAFTSESPSGSTRRETRTSAPARPLLTSTTRSAIVSPAFRLSVCGAAAR